MKSGRGKAAKNVLKILIICLIPSSYFQVQKPQHSAGESYTISSLRVVKAGKSENKNNYYISLVSVLFTHHN